MASVLFYVEAWNRIQGKLACTQSKCSWILPPRLDEVRYAGVKEIDFRSAKKLKDDLDKSIEKFSNVKNTPTPTMSAKSASQDVDSMVPGVQEIADLF